MCDTYLHPRPSFFTFLRSDANGSSSVKKCPKAGIPLKQHVKITPRNEKIKTPYRSFHPIYTPLIDNVSGTISSAIEKSLTDVQSKTSSGGFVKFYDDCNISKPPQKTTPSLNSQQTFARPQTAPARIANKTGHLDKFFAVDTLAEKLIQRQKSLAYSTRKADVKIETEQSGVVAWRIIGGQMVPKISAALPAAKNERDALEIKLISILQAALPAAKNERDALEIKLISILQAALPAAKNERDALEIKLISILQAALPAAKNERDALEIKTRYTSVSHKAMEEIPWTVKSTPTSKTFVRETKPDMVKQQIQRYESKAHAWQAVGPAFDRASPRKHTFCTKPIAYVSESRQTQYTPGYTGEVPLVSGELGSPDSQLVKKTDVKRDLPPATAVSRKANISGYAGYVRPGTTQPAHYLKPATTQTLTHREIPASARSQGEMYPRVSPVSNLVTLTHPYNPYNSINPTIQQRA
ncbi:hypothetical protein ACHWQZ_G008483 [Mnemiopsis leidyi]